MEEPAFYQEREEEQDDSSPAEMRIHKALVLEWLIKTYYI